MTFIIAEIGQAHEGSLGIAHSYIDALAETGVHAIKWQTHIAEAESSTKEPFRINFSYEDVTRIEYWERMEFSLDQWVGIKIHCEDKKMEFISSPFSNAAVDLLEKIDVRRYKIGSGEITNFLMLEKIAKIGKPVIISSGMSSFNELDKTINFLKQFNIELSVLQCTTAYPTTPYDWGLNVIGELKERYNLPVGFSDHSGEIYASLAAVSLGASILEFHAVFDKRMFGPDSKASLNIDQIKHLVKGVEAIGISLDNSIDKTDNSRFGELKMIFEKSLAINRDLEKGEVISREMLEAKKPKSQGIDAQDYLTVIGKCAKKNFKKWDFITKDDID